MSNVCCNAIHFGKPWLLVFHYLYVMYYLLSFYLRGRFGQGATGVQPVGLPALYAFGLAIVFRVCSALGRKGYRFAEA